jgi:predicted amidohydrolase
VTFSSESSPSPVKSNLSRSLQLLEHLISFRLFSLSFPLRLVAFPEWFLQGSHYKNKSDFFKVCLKIPGEETDKLGEIAKKNRMYICGHGFEVDQKYGSNRFFSTAFVIGPQGKVALKYRKLTTTNMNLTLATSPHDILDEYEEEIFPVLKTEIGNLACFVSYDRHFPEIPRAFAFKGAEVFLMPSVAMEPWMSPPTDWWTVINRARAQENLSYLVAPNAGWMKDSSHPISYAVGRSQIVDYNGVILAEAGSSNETIISATIDIDRLRKRRSKAPWNFLAEIRTEVFQSMYDCPIFPSNLWLKKDPKSFSEIDRAHALGLQNFARMANSNHLKTHSRHRGRKNATKQI